MFDSISATPIYTNSNIISNLGAAIIEGFIDSKNLRNSIGLAGNLRTSKDCKVQKNSEDKVTTTTSDDSSFFDGKVDYRNEVNIKTIYSTFYLFNNIRDSLIKRNQLRYVTEKDILDNRVRAGEYIEFNAELSTSSAANSISTVVDVLSSYDIKVLDDLVKSKLGGYLNCSVILNQLKCLGNCLNRNGTTDIVMNFKNCKAVLDINTNYFCDKNACMYDTAHSNCTVMCKVVKCLCKEEYCCLLRKTAMSDYYNTFLASIKPYLEVLNANGIIIPYNFETRIEGPAVQAIPVAMYI